MRKWNVAIGEDQPDNKIQKSGKIRHLQKQAVSYWAEWELKMYGYTTWTGTYETAWTKQKQYKKMSLLTSRASHLSAGIASHALLTIMLKDIPLLFWLIPFCRILINSLNYLDKHQESLIQTLWKQKFLEILSQTAYAFATK